MSSRLIAAMAFMASGAAAQQDSSRALAPVVVIAERIPTTLTIATAAITRITAAELARVPHASLADALKLVPGIAVVDFGGTGRDPQLMVRGFYGGGEAEYAVVMVDGRPVNGVHNGVVPWDALPSMESITSVEVIRGSASALYGDAAVGAVINIRTREAEGSRSGNWRLQGGSFASVRAGVDVSRPSVFGAIALDRDGGFRDHAERLAGSMRVRAVRSSSPGRRRTFTFAAYARAFDEPGPLLESLMADRSASDPLFRFDHTTDIGASTGIEGERPLKTGLLRTSLSFDWRSSTGIRTLALTPGFGDSKDRRLSHHRLTGSAQLDAGGPLPADWLTVGAEVGYAGLESKYYDVFTGDRDDYATASGDRGNLAASGSGSRVALALYGHYALEPLPALRVSLGARGDLVQDTFDPALDDVDHLAEHGAFSPKAGLNFRYARTEFNAGNVYVTASGSFKTPTLDQLFDQRPVPVPFPPFAITTSNADLSPQRGTSLEAGLYHSVLARGTRVALSLSAYRMNMRDELDFDVQTLSYVNIGRSSHRGFEAGLTVSMPFTSPAFLNYARQTVRSRTGAFAGNRLKAIPRAVLTAGLPLGPGSTLDPRLIVTHASGAFLDDANTRRLPSYTRVDVQWLPRLRRARLVFEVRNLLNARYSTTGYLDPAGTGEAYFYPAAGRIVEVGIRSGW